MSEQAKVEVVPCKTCGGHLKFGYAGWGCDKCNCFRCPCHGITPALCPNRKTQPEGEKMPQDAKDWVLCQLFGDGRIESVNKQAAENYFTGISITKIAKLCEQYRLTASAPVAQRRYSGEIAKAFHEAYERLAPDFGYETRKESAVAWEDVPRNNRMLMISVCEEILDLIYAAPLASQPQAAPRQTRFDDFDDDGHPFKEWWEKHGQYMMSGGGRRESIWAARGWIAREQLSEGVAVTGESIREKPSAVPAPEPAQALYSQSGNVQRCPECKMPLTWTPECHLPECSIRECCEANLRSSGWTHIDEAEPAAAQPEEREILLTRIEELESGFRPALTKLCMALGNPTLYGTQGSSLEEQLILLAAEKLAAHKGESA